MRSIIRCPECFTFVYSDARHCHGCGHRIGKRQILTRGSWVFIILAVSAFTVLRAVDIKQDRRWRYRRDVEAAERVEEQRSFLRAWITEPAADVSTRFSATRPEFGAALLALRDRFPDVFPATAAVDIRIVDSDSSQVHRQVDANPTAPILHRNEKDRATLRATDPAIRRLPASFMHRNSGNVRWWNIEANRFTAQVQRDEHSYTVSGTVCTDNDDVVRCVEIETVTSIEGVIKPR